MIRITAIRSLLRVTFSSDKKQERIKFIFWTVLIKAVRGSIMRAWIDEKIDYLHPLLGRVPAKDFIFEPTKEFYEKLERIEVIPPIEVVLKNIDEDKPPFVTFDVATEDIAKHLGLNIPRTEFHPFKRNINEPNIAGRIQVGGSSREIQISSDYKEKAKQLGTILAHEIAHDVLYSKDITLSDSNENEKLTDLTAVMLGLGKLFLNGMEEKTGGMTSKLCYLSISDIAYAYVKINALYKVPIDKYFPNLTYAAYSKIKPFLDEMEVKKSRSMMKDVKEKCSEVRIARDRVNKMHRQIRDNQELINKNVGSLKIEPDDSRIFVDLNSYSFQQNFESHISYIDGDLCKINNRLDSEQERVSADAIQSTLQGLRDLDLQITRRKREVERYLGQLFEALSTQEKYFPKRSNIMEERIKELIREKRIKEVLILAGKEDYRLLTDLSIEFAKKKDPLALEIFDKIIKFDLNDAVVYYNRGNMYRDLNQQNMAINDYTKAIRLNPDYATAYINCGNVYFRLKRYSEAINDYTEAIKLNSSYADAYTNRGNVHLRLKQCLEAINDFQMAVKLNPDDYAARDNLKKAFSSLKEERGMVIYVKTKIKTISRDIVNRVKGT